MLVKDFNMTKTLILALVVNFIVVQETTTLECLLVEDYCKWPQGYVPDEVDVNLCRDQQIQERCFPHFDTSWCTTNPCLLGYQTDKRGCVNSCVCKKSGLLGDIMVYKEDLEDYEVAYGLVPDVRGASVEARKWTNIKEGNNYIIPYKFSPAIGKMPHAMAVVRHALEQFHLHTCLKFQPWDTEEDHIYFYFGTKCSSHIGKRKYSGRQYISLGLGCFETGIVVHEVMHMLGFFHEQSRPDRDNYVEVLSENIIGGRGGSPYMNNFLKRKQWEVDSMGSPYDYGSILHYGGCDFSSNGRATIRNKRTGKPVVKQRKAFSFDDLYQLKKMYHCID